MLKVGQRVDEKGRKGVVVALHTPGTVDVLFDDMDFAIRRQMPNVIALESNPRRSNSTALRYNGRQHRRMRMRRNPGYLHYKDFEWDGSDRTIWKFEVLDKEHSDSKLSLDFTWTNYSFPPSQSMEERLSEVTRKMASLLDYQIFDPPGQEQFSFWWIFDYKDDLDLFFYKTLINDPRFMRDLQRVISGPQRQRLNSAGDNGRQHRRNPMESRELDDLIRERDELIYIVNEGSRHTGSTAFYRNEMEEIARLNDEIERLGKWPEWPEHPPRVIPKSLTAAEIQRSGRAGDGICLQDIQHRHLSRGRVHRGLGPPYNRDPHAPIQSQAQEPKRTLQSRWTRKQIDDKIASIETGLYGWENLSQRLRRDGGRWRRSSRSGNVLSRLGRC